MSLLMGCSASSYALEADGEVSDLLDASASHALEARPDRVRSPEQAAPEVDADSVEPTGTNLDLDALDEPDVPRAELRTIDFEQALTTAFVSAREIITRRESVYLRGLGLTLTRFNFGPQVNATLDYLYNDSEQGSASRFRGGRFGVSQILPTGGLFSVNSALSRDHQSGSGGSNSVRSNVDFRVSQPLLRGAGYEVSHEALTQAERSIIYEVRNFELFRQGFAIDIARDYFDLVRQRTQLSNEEQNYQDAVFDKEKALALRTLDRNKDEDVFLARRREIDAETRLLNAQTDFKLALDSFRIRLGLSKDVALEILEEDPPFEGIRLDAESAVEVALFNRLDLINEREQLEDSARQVRNAKNGLLPDVDLALAYGQSGFAENLSDAEPDDWSTSVGLSVEIPIQRTPERNSYRAALIAYDRARRAYDLLLENTERDVRNALRQLRNTEQQIDLQVQQIGQEQRAVAVTELRFESGDVDARDLLDARQALINAENELIRLQVDHFISRLRLYRDLGLLFIDPSGMWST